MTITTTPLFGRMHGQGWHLYPKRRAVLFIIAPIMGLLIIIGGVSLASQGGTGLYMGALLALVGIAIGIVPLTKRTVRRDVVSYSRDGVAGTLIPVRPVGVLRIFMFGTLSVLFMVLAVLALVVGVRDNNWAAGLGGIGFGLVLSGMFALAVVATIKARRAPAKGIFVSPSGIVLAERATPISVQWSELAGIRAHWRRRATAIRRVPSPLDFVANWLTLERQEQSAEGRKQLDRQHDVYSFMSGTKEPSIRVDDLACEPYAVLAALEAYAHNVQARGELGTIIAQNRFAGR